MSPDAELDKPLKRSQIRERRPAEILAAAFEEFQQKGFTATSIDDIAERTGLSKGSIYNYFKSKEHLFREVILSLIVPVLERTAEFSANFPGSSERLLRHHLETLYHSICIDTQSRGLLHLLVAEGDKFPELITLYRHEVVELSYKIFGKVLQRGVASGEFRPDAPVDCPHVIIAPIMMYALHRGMFGKEHMPDTDAYMEHHITLTLAGLRAPGP